MLVFWGHRSRLSVPDGGINVVYAFENRCCVIVRLKDKNIEYHFPYNSAWAVVFRNIGNCPKNL